MTDPLLHQADALMRRRSFVAGARTPEAAAAAETAERPGADHDDVPILTEVVAPDAGSPAPVTSADAAAAASNDELEARLLAQQQAFHKTLETWLETALPKAVARALDGLGDYVVNELRDNARAELLPGSAPTTDEQP